MWCLYWGVWSTCKCMRILGSRIYSIFSMRICRLQLLVPPEVFLFRPCTCACNMPGCSHRTGITCGGPGDPEGPLWISCDLNILVGYV